MSAKIDDVLEVLLEVWVRRRQRIGPGEEWSYSNSGYAPLMEIVTRHEAEGPELTPA